MTDPTTPSPPEARLWTLSGFQADPWRNLDSADDLSETGHAILPLETYLAVDPEKRRAANTRLGVRIAPGEAIEKIADLLDDLPLVALEFPAFSDGRSYSKAEILRRRYGYEGKVRAVGQVLPDQISHMLRVGFDELSVTHPVALKWLEEGKTQGLGLYSQPSARDEQPAGTYSWRRRAAD